jgi:hypothetical protein
VRDRQRKVVVLPWRKLGFGFFAGTEILFFNTDFNPWYPTATPHLHSFTETLSAMVGAGLAGAFVAGMIWVWQSRHYH